MLQDSRAPRPGQPPREARLALDSADFGRYNASGEGVACLPLLLSSVALAQRPPAPKIRAVKGGGRCAGTFSGIGTARCDILLSCEQRLSSIIRVTWFT